MDTVYAQQLDMATWLTTQRNSGATPGEIAEQLIGQGYSADGAAAQSMRSLRSSDRQSLLFASLTISAGFAALSFATSMHQLIAGNPDPVGLATMLSLFIVSLPIAVTCGVLAHRAEQRSKFVLWSPSRRGWYGALALSAASVGIVRLLAYLFDMISTLTGASHEPWTFASLSQVLVSVGVAVPLFAWSFYQWRRSNLVSGAIDGGLEGGGEADARNSSNGC